MRTIRLKEADARKFAQGHVGYVNIYELAPGEVWPGDVAFDRAAVRNRRIYHEGKLLAPAYRIAVRAKATARQAGIWS